MENLPNSSPQKPSSQESDPEKGKKEKITLEINGQIIEGEKYYFEYPEKIQKETGIMGYERVKIQNNFLENIDSRKILLELSNGEYPNQCFNHTVGGFAHEQDKSKMEEDIVKDNFFIQKLYSLEAIERNKEHGMISGDNIFNYATQFSDQADTRTSIRSSFSVFGKEDDSLLNDKKRPAELGSLVNEGSYAASTGQGGFNTVAGHFWSNKDMKSMSVGFPMWGTDNFLTDYLEKALKIYAKIERPVEGLRENMSLQSAVILYCMAQYGKKQNNNEMTKEDVNQIMESFIKENPESSALINIKDFSDIMWGYFNDENWDSDEKDFNARILNHGRSEWLVPVFIGHDEIPQLSWGHAKYAHYFNDKGFNFFKFKHADHMPAKS